MTKRLLELLESGLNYLNSDAVEEALKEFMICEELYKKYYSQLDSNYLSVLKYNLACCY